MQALMGDRIIWKDNRFSINVAPSDSTMPGGVSAIRSTERLAGLCVGLRERWGKHLRGGDVGSDQEVRRGPTPSVVRRQPVKYGVKYDL